MEEAAALLEELGHSVEEAPPPPWRDDSLFELFMKAWQVIPALNGKPIELLEPNNRALVEAARETDSVEYVLATVQLRSLGRATVEYVSQYGLLLDADARPAARAGRDRDR